MAQVILEIKRYQCTPYNFVRIDEVIEWLETRPVMNAEDLYQTSIELEPRAAASGTPSSYSGFSVGHSDNMAGGTGGSAIASGGLAGSMGMFTTRRLSGVKAFAQLRGSSPAGF